MKRSTLPAHGGMLMVSLIYGVNYFTAKMALDVVHPLAAVAMRCLVATAVFWVFHALVIKEKVKGWKDYGLLFLCAVFGISLNQICFLWGLSKTLPINAGVLMITTPVFVFLLSFLTKREKITWFQVLGLAVAFMGSFLLIQANAGGTITLDSQYIQGDLLIILNAASYGAYLVLVRPLILKYNTFTIVKWLFIFGTLINATIGAPKLIQEFPFVYETDVYIGLALLILGATLVAYFLNAWAMKRVPPSSVGVYIFVQPVVVTIVTLFLSPGLLTWGKLMFIGQISIGVFLVTMFRPEWAIPAVDFISRLFRRIFSGK